MGQRMVRASETAIDELFPSSNENHQGRDLTEERVRSHLVEATSAAHELRTSRKEYEGLQQRAKELQTRIEVGLSRVAKNVDVLQKKGFVLSDWSDFMREVSTISVVDDPRNDDDIDDSGIGTTSDDNASGDSLEEGN